MQKDEDIKMLAIIRIMESDNTTKDIIKLLKFVKEATTDQIKGLLLYGKMMPQTDILKESVNSREVDIVFERLISEAGGKIAQARKTYFSAANSPVGNIVYGAGAIGAGMPAAPALAGAAFGAGLWALYRFIRGKYDQCTKKCGTFEINSARRQHCMAKCKVAKFTARLAAAQKKKNAEEIAKNKAKLAKAKEVFANYEKSFQGKNKPGQ